MTTESRRRYTSHPKKSVRKKQGSKGEVGMDAKREVQIRLIAERRPDGLVFVTCPSVPIFSAIVPDDKEGWARALDLLNAHVRKNASASIGQDAA